MKDLSLSKNPGMLRSDWLYTPIYEIHVGILVHLCLLILLFDNNVLIQLFYWNKIFKIRVLFFLVF